MIERKRSVYLFFYEQVFLFLVFILMVCSQTISYAESNPSAPPANVVAQIYSTTYSNQYSTNLKRMILVTWEDQSSDEDGFLIINKRTGRCLAVVDANQSAGYAPFYESGVKLELGVCSIKYTGEPGDFEHSIRSETIYPAEPLVIPVDPPSASYPDVTPSSVAFTINIEYPCTKICIDRSSDGTNFERIREIDEAEKYWSPYVESPYGYNFRMKQFTDNTVLGGTYYYYRISCVSLEGVVSDYYQCTASVPYPYNNIVNLEAIDATTVKVSWKFLTPSNIEGASFRLTRDWIDPATGEGRTISTGYIDINACKQDGETFTYIDADEDFILANTEYTYSITVKRKVTTLTGESYYTFSCTKETLSVKTPIPVPPVMPDNLMISQLDRNMAKFCWQDNSNNEKKFQVWESSSPLGPFGLGSYSNIIVPEVEANTTSIDLCRMYTPGRGFRLGGETVYYAIAAIRVQGGYTVSSCSEPVSYKWPLDYVTGISLSSNSSNSVDIEWTDNGNVPGCMYSISRRGAYEPETAYVPVAVVNAGVKSYTDSSVEPGRSYVYKISAIKDGDEGRGSAVQVTVKEDVPKIPVLKYTERYDGANGISWNGLSENEKGIIIERASSISGPFAVIADNAIKNNQPNYLYYDISTTVPGTTYYYRAKTYNSCGTSAYSAVIGTLAGPRDLTASNVSTKTLKLSWTDSVAGEIAYTVMYKAPGTENYTVLANLTANTTSYNVTGLSPNNIYDFVVYFTLAGENSEYSNVCSVRTLSDPPTGAPTYVKLTPLDSGAVLVEWVPKFTKETGYKIERLNTQGTFDVVGKIAASINSYTGYTDISTEEFVCYTYRITPFNDSGDGPSSQAYTMSVPTSLKAPSDLIVVGTGKTSVLLKWAGNSMKTLEYRVERSSALNGPYSIIGTVNPSVTSFTDSSLVTGNTYFYRVRGWYSSSINRLSNVVSGTPCASKLAVRSFKEISFKSSALPLDYLTYVLTVDGPDAGDAIKKCGMNFRSEGMDKGVFVLYDKEKNVITAKTSDDEGTSWTNGASQGVSKFVNNLYAVIDRESTSVNVSSQGELTMTVKIAFTKYFTGKKDVSAYISDSCDTLTVQGEALSVLVTPVFVNLDSDSPDEIVVNNSLRDGLKIVNNGSNSTTPLHSLTPDQMIRAHSERAEGDCLVVDFGRTYGVWMRLVDGTWELVHRTSPEYMTAADIDGDGLDEVIIDFGESGVYAYFMSRAKENRWKKIHAKSPRLMVKGDVDADGKHELIIDFGAPYGIWIYNYGAGEQWFILHNGISDDIVTSDSDSDGYDEITIDFGERYGLWRVTLNPALAQSKAWQNLHNVNPRVMEACDMNGDGRNEIIVDFFSETTGTEYGIYSLDGRSGWVGNNLNLYWDTVHSKPANTIGSGKFDGTSIGDEVLIDFGQESKKWVNNVIATSSTDPAWVKISDLN